MRYINVHCVDAVVGALFVGARHVVLHSRKVFSTERKNRLLYTPPPPPPPPPLSFFPLPPPPAWLA